MCELALKWLDIAGLFPTTPDERRIELSWPSPLPENEIEKLQEAEVKLRSQMLFDTYLSNFPQAIFEGWSLDALQTRARDQIRIILAGARPLIAAWQSDPPGIPPPA
jgi:hypothetical protein